MSWKTDITLDDTQPWSNLIRRVGLKKGVQLVHLSDVGPQVDQTSWYLEVAEECSCNSDVLKLWHELAIKAAHGVSCEEASPFTCQHLVNPAIESSFSSESKAMGFQQSVL